MKELKNIFPEKVKVMFGPDVIEIKPIILKDLPVVAEIAEKVFDKIFKLLMSGKQDKDLGLEIAKEIISILKNDFESIQKLLEMTTTVSPEVIPDLSLEASLFLIDEVLEVNKDFLSQKVFPMVKAMLAKYQPKKEKTNG